jgi:EAL domain-containing protein (putative c-di-GMP-specific phosphodiesterase class I)/GGDEF domain-containing protein
MRLDDLLTSGFDFTPEESNLKYRYKLINAMFFTGIFITFIAMGVRLLAGEYTLMLLDSLLMLLFAGGLLYLRTNQDVFEKVATFQLVVSFLFMTALVLMLGENHTKLLLFVMLLIAVFTIKGPRIGMLSYGLIITMLSIFYITPILYPPLKSVIDLQMNATEIVMAMLFYSVIALFHLFAAIEQQENFENLTKATKKIEHQKEQLFKQLRTSSDTDLPNSLALNEKLSTLSPQQKAGLITLQIDDYILLADEFGMETANTIVRESAGVLRQFAEDTISLYHVGPYHFSFLFEDTEERKLIAFAEKIKNYFEHLDLSVGNMELSISFTMGIATGMHDKLITHANTALFEAQKIGANAYKLFKDDKKREEAQRENIYWNRKIKEIINQDMLHLYYQPIVDNKTTEIIKYECLIRAIEKGEVIAPYRFLQAAKTRGILPNITRFVIDESFRYFSDKSIDFTINITAEDLQDNYLVNYLYRKSREYGIEPARVYLEILESMTADQTQDTIGQFHILKEMGFKFAIDDFGSEASNLSRLLTYKAEIIKIDGQFIKNIDTDTKSLRIVQTIVYLANKLETKTVAEFVHSEAIYKIVKELGVDYSQGYFFGEPKPKIIEEHISLPA